MSSRIPALGGERLAHRNVGEPPLHAAFSVRAAGRAYPVSMVRRIDSFRPIAPTEKESQYEA
jgi:hypothetical protein